MTVVGKDVDKNQSSNDHYCGTRAFKAIVCILRTDEQ